MRWTLGPADLSDDGGSTLKAFPGLGARSTPEAFRFRSGPALAGPAFAANEIATIARFPPGMPSGGNAAGLI
jgi:hypothetical protein